MKNEIHTYTTIQELEVISVLHSSKTNLLSSFNSEAFETYHGTDWLILWSSPIMISIY